MKKTAIAWMLLAGLALSLAGCGRSGTAQTAAPAAEPQATAETQAPAQDEIVTVGEDETPSASAVTEAPVIDAGRQDGERFEAVIMLEGMEETVRYEHIRSEALGFEMDYDYENFIRRTEEDRERFISDWDDAEHPENYLEVSADTGNANLVADVIIAQLSEEYEPYVETVELDGVGECIRIDASEIKGGGFMAEQLQTVYIIPAGRGCLVAAAHYAIEGAEGYGRRFSYMMNTLTLIGRGNDGALTDEQALSAVSNYCYSVNPDLAAVVSSDEHPVSWEISASDAQQVVVLFRSYTGAEVRYYIDRVTGETSVTEFVSGITAQEEPTGESFNAWDYLD